MNFTQTTYKTLLETLKINNYKLLTFKKYLQSINLPNYSSHNKPLAILRHDIDRLPYNALKIAQLEHDLGIRGTYYFRIVPESFDADTIEKIADLGHEVGCHYEDIDLVRGDRSKVKGDRRQVGVRGRRSAKRSQRSDFRSRRGE